jgi:hypothetical protein
MIMKDVTLLSESWSNKEECQYQDNVRLFNDIRSGERTYVMRKSDIKSSDLSIFHSISTQSYRFPFTRFPFHSFTVHDAVDVSFIYKLVAHTRIGQTTLIYQMGSVDSDFKSSFLMMYRAGDLAKMQMKSPFRKAASTYSASRFFVMQNTFSMVSQRLF